MEATDTSPSNDAWQPLTPAQKPAVPSFDDIKTDVVIPFVPADKPKEHEEVVIPTPRHKDHQVIIPWTPLVPATKMETPTTDTDHQEVIPWTPLTPAAKVETPQLPPTTTTTSQSAVTVTTTSSNRQVVANVNTHTETSKQNRLPQTGNQQTVLLVLLGASLTLTSFAGLARKRV